MMAHFRCNKCSTEWHWEFFGGDPNDAKAHAGSTICPKCANLYYTWLNFERIK